MSNFSLTQTCPTVKTLRAKCLFYLFFISNILVSNPAYSLQFYAAYSDENSANYPSITLHGTINLKGTSSLALVSVNGAKQKLMGLFENINHNISLEAIYPNYVLFRTHEGIKSLKLTSTNLTNAERYYDPNLEIGQSRIIN